jgi:hypothetical protein
MKIRHSLVLATVMALAMLAAAQADPAKPMRIRLSFGAADKLKIHDVTPTYPKEARESSSTGRSAACHNRCQWQGHQPEATARRSNID